jgi:hypothetical protein
MGQRSSVVELLICNQPVGGSSPSAGSCRGVGRQLSTFLQGVATNKERSGRLPEWLKGTDCKSVTSVTQVRILYLPLANGCLGGKLIGKVDLVFLGMRYFDVCLRGGLIVAEEKA